MMSVSPGDVIGSGYRVVDLLGEGLFGTALHVSHSITSREYALKVLRPEVCGDAEDRARFARDAEIAKGLDHPRLVKLYDYSLVEDPPYLVCGLVTTPDLRELMAAGPIPVLRALGLARQIAEGAGCLHEHGLSLTDLRPESVKVSSTDEVTILDLGLVEHLVAVAWKNDPDAQDERLRKAFRSRTRPSSRKPSAQFDATPIGWLLYEMLVGADSLRRWDNPRFSLMFHDFFMPTTLWFGNEPPVGATRLLRDLMRRLVGVHVDGPLQTGAAAAEAISSVETSLTAGGHSRTEAKTLEHWVSFGRSPTTPVNPGDVLHGRYVVLNPLGHSTVRVKDLTTSCECVMRILPSEVRSSPAVPSLTLHHGARPADGAEQSQGLERASRESRQGLAAEPWLRVPLQPVPGDQRAPSGAAGPPAQTSPATLVCPARSDVPTASTRAQPSPVAGPCGSEANPSTAVLARGGGEGRCVLAWAVLLSAVLLLALTAALHRLGCVPVSPARPSESDGPGRRPDHRARTADARARGASRTRDPSRPGGSPWS